MSTNNFRKFAAAAQVIDDLDPRMPWQQGMCLVVIMQNELKGGDPLDLKELGQIIKAPSSTMSRHLQAFSKVNRMGKPGLDLVEDVTDYQDRRRKVMRLTTKGKRVLAKIQEKLK